MKVIIDHRTRRDTYLHLGWAREDWRWTPTRQHGTANWGGYFSLSWLGFSVLVQQRP